LENGIRNEGISVSMLSDTHWDVIVSTSSQLREHRKCVSTHEFLVGFKEVILKCWVMAEAHHVLSITNYRDDIKANIPCFTLLGLWR
jgi:hypothetical protein